MHVTIVSACEKRAIKRSRAIIDSFAACIGPQTWHTSITEEGVGELRRALKRTATRQTSVACFRNDGRKRMRLLWIVGSRAGFDRDGRYRVGHTRSVRTASPPSEWIRLTALIASTAGFAHDWGKAVAFFQEKLRQSDGQPIKDPVRHEWLSLRLYEAFHANADVSPNELLGQLAGNPRAMAEKPDWIRKRGLQSWEDALGFVIATHHKMFVADGRAIGIGNHVRLGESGIREVGPSDYELPAPIPERPLRKALSNTARIAAMPAAAYQDPYYWRGIATIARACVVLADQFVSSKPRAANDRCEDGLFANTKDNALSQSLEWHLKTVAHHAGDLVYRIANLSLEGLSDDAVEQILTPSGSGRFEWQDAAVDALRVGPDTSAVPTLVVNMAETGAGKTRMNAKAVCALAGDNPVRFATALNLRTLTLQTGDAYQDELGIAGDEIACVIGDSVVKHLHDQAGGRQSDSGSGNLDPEGDERFDFEMDVTGEASETDLPAWLAEVVADRPGAARMLAPPTLVSTVDTLVKAGEPQHQAHHTVQMIRVTSGDLVLDELDGYDPDALVAVLRLVTLAGLFGRNVVVSSATIPRPVVRALAKAFQAGVRMYSAFDSDRPNRFRCAWIDNRVSPEIDCYTADGEDAPDQVAATFDSRLERLDEALSGASRKIPELAPVAASEGEDNLYEAAAAAVERLHSRHAQRGGEESPRVSVGFVRCANIRTAIPMARYLAASVKGARVCCYHANDCLIQRYHKERRLDALLNRKKPGVGLIDDPAVRRLAASTEGDDLILIVVATPVEEVGRDHDFDWAVLEPSSTHSLVQAAGRVNRHRLIDVNQPNIAILQRNALSLRGDPSGRAFIRPGLESEDNHHPSHDLAELLDWDNLDNIDARLRFNGKHPFAKADDAALSDMLEHRGRALHRFLDVNRPFWMSAQTYRDAQLRDNTPKERFRLDAQENCYQEDRRNACPGESRWYLIDLDTPYQVPRADNDWLTLSVDEMIALADEVGISVEQALCVSLTSPPRDQDGNIKPGYEKPTWDRSFGWQYNKRSA